MPVWFRNSSLVTVGLFLGLIMAPAILGADASCAEAQPPAPPNATAASKAERAFQELEREMLARLQSRMAQTGGRMDLRARAQIEQGHELVVRWTAFLKQYPEDRALAFRAKNYLVQGHHLANQTEDALRLLEAMEGEAQTVEEILSVAMGCFHVRDSKEAGAQVLDRFAARNEDHEVIAAVTLEKRMFVDGRNRAQRKAKRLEIARRVSQAYPKTAAGRRAALMVRAVELAPGRRPLDISAFRDVTGKPILLESYRGKVLLLHFWAASIGECMRELPAVIETFRTQHRNGFEVLSVSLDRDPNVTKRAVDQHRLGWRHHCDGRGWANEVAVLYAVDTLPWSILIGRDGKVAAVNPPPKELRDQVEKLLRAPPAPPHKAPDTPARSDPR